MALWCVFSNTINIHIKALRYPVLCGLNLPFEVELYWIEHILGAFIGPLTLTLSGRFILFDSHSFIAHQLIGWSSHIFYQRVLIQIN